jgi:uncharacterized membrane protein YfcA
MTHLDVMHLSSATLVLLLMALFVAGTTKGLLGIGMPIVAVPLLNLIVDLRIAVILLAVPLIITNIPQAIHGDRIPIVLRRLWPILAGMVFGVGIGVTLLSMTNPNYLKPVVGIILLAVCALMWFAPKLTVPPRLEPIASPGAGFVGGLAGGLAALPGPFVFVYLLALGLKRDQFVQYSSMFLVISAAVMTVFLRGKGVMSWTDAGISTLATLPIFVGMWAGGFVRNYVSQGLFRKLILVVVAVSGAQMLMVAIH